MTLIARLLALFIVAFAAYPARAADPVYPAGVRVGLIPSGGLTLSREFTGFLSADEGVKVIVGELPIAAFKAVEEAQKAGLQPGKSPKIDPIQTAAGPGYVTSETAKNAGRPTDRHQLG